MGEAPAAAALAVNSAPLLREIVSPCLLYPFLSPSALFLLLFPAINCLVVADAIKTRCVCSLSLRSPPSSEVFLCLRARRWRLLACESSSGPRVGGLVPAA